MQAPQGITQQITTTLPASSSVKRSYELPEQSVQVKLVAVCAMPKPADATIKSVNRIFFMDDDYKWFAILLRQTKYTDLFQM